MRGAAGMRRGLVRTRSAAWYQVRTQRWASAFERCRSSLPVSGHAYYSLEALGDARVERLPLSVRVLLESALREAGSGGRGGGAAAAAAAAAGEGNARTILDFARQAGRADITWRPPRVIMQDLSGVPALIDLCALRDALAARGGDPRRVNPLSPVDVVVDHSVSVDFAGRPDALARNMDIEFKRNRERFQFLRWAQGSFDNFSLVPPGSGIVHQVHCESLARVVMVQDGLAFPDACVGTDSHTPMVNGLGVVGWGVGGIEAEAAMLGQSMSMVLPEVVGLELTGELRPGVTATDLVLTVTELLRGHGVVGKFVEALGPGARSLAVTDRMTVANMAPEYGATVVFFPTDAKTLDYLRSTGRPDEMVGLVEEYTKANGLFGAEAAAGAAYSSVARLDLAAVEPCVAGPKRPQDRVPLSRLKSSFAQGLIAERGLRGYGLAPAEAASAVDVGGGEQVRHGALAIAAITSCTNTSNPSVLVAAGLLAKKAVELGLTVPEHVKTSLAPGSKVVTRYLEAAGLQAYLDRLGFHTVGYGCTTCMGNSGDVHPRMQAAADGGVVTAAVLSGNRNFEGRVHLSVKANYLASPPLVVAAALAGRVDIDFDSEPLGLGLGGRPVFLRDVWPAASDIDAAVSSCVRPSMFREAYGELRGSAEWEALPQAEGLTFPWDEESTFIRRPPFLDRSREPLREAHCLLLLGDSVTTDHISPVSAIREGPAFEHLRARGVEKRDMASFGARRGNAEVMVRGTFANPRLANRLLGKPGPRTLHVPSGEVMTVFDAAERYRVEGWDLVVVAGAEYGTGSSRDWAAKGTALLGIRAVLAKSFERIHRSNLVGMGVLPLAFEGAEEVGLTGLERFALHVPGDPAPGDEVEVTATAPDGAAKTFRATLRLDTDAEVSYWKSGGIMPYVLNTLG